eukprot:5268461-Pyramimonas_sp.AAC.1
MLDWLPIAGRIQFPIDVDGRLFHCVCLRLTNHGNLPGNRFSLGWWGDFFRSQASRSNRAPSRAEAAAPSLKF